MLNPLTKWQLRKKFKYSLYACFSSEEKSVINPTLEIHFLSYTQTTTLRDIELENPEWNNGPSCQVCSNELAASQLNFMQYISINVYEYEMISSLFFWNQIIYTNPNSAHDAVSRI
jgi:hypothetical protein